MCAPLLIALPDGLSVSGVTTWAVRLVNALAGAGRACGLVVHPEPAEGVRLDVALNGDVEVFDAPVIGDFAGVVERYRTAAQSLAGRGGPVVLSPNLRGDCYGVGASLVECGVRLVGWQHSDIEYDRRVLAYFEPVIERFVGVSRLISDRLGAAIDSRGGDIVHIPYGVEVARDVPGRAALSGRPIRLIYTGRMEHRQKRILSLVHLSDELRARGIDHELILLGDGPAAGEIDRLCASRASIRRVDPVGPGRVGAMLEDADFFVLGSRYEGLSVSMLEAMARGCVPIVARVASGATEAIEHACNGMIAEVDPDAPEPEVGAALASVVAACLDADVGAMSRRAWLTVAERYSIELHAARVGELIDEVASAPARRWPGGRVLAFDSEGGSVGADAERLLMKLLDSLAGRRIAIHGVGAHTRQLWPVFADSAARIVALVDDDRAVHGSMRFDLPVVPPDSVAGTGATDVVISSWMHENEIWSRREVYEEAGLRVHRIYCSTRSNGSMYVRSHASFNDEGV